MLGITDRAISKWETGKSLPDSSIMLDLCDILGVQGAECCKIAFENSGADIQVTSGVLREEALKVLSDYFSKNKKAVQLNW